MLADETSDKILKTVSVCNRHKAYLIFAMEQNADLFPMTLEIYDHLTSIQVSFLDQMIYRFSKLQDTIGNRLIKGILDHLGEDSEKMSFKDKLLKLEKLDIMPSADEWFELREIRNLVSHEYPEDMNKLIAGLNLLHKKAYRLTVIYSGLLEFLDRSLPVNQ